MNRTTRLLLLAAAAAAISASSLALADNLAARDPAGALVTREIAWDGSESVVIDVPANVHFVQTDGAAKVVVRGPKRSVEKFSASGGFLSDATWRTGANLEITVHAPKVTRFTLKGGDRLTIEGFDQNELAIETTGRAEVKAAGRTGKLVLRLQGAGWADLSALKAGEADVSVTGSRHALLNVSQLARVSGNGSVVLVSKPTTLDLNLGESGRVFTLGGNEAG